MSADGLQLIIYVLLALVFSFLCSVAESVLLSITPSYIEGQKERRPNYAALLKQLRQDNVDRSLAAILTLNTIAHAVGAIGAGSKATVVFGSTWFGLFSAVMTLLILFLTYYPTLAIFRSAKSNVLSLSDLLGEHFRSLFCSEETSAIIHF